MPSRCRWCPRPPLRTVTVEGPEGTPRRMALCDRHLMAVQRARSSHPDAAKRQQRLAEMEAWQKVFGEPPPFEALTD
jgi:hypothetical protein